MQESILPEQEHQGEKRCPRCNTWLPLSKFRQRSATKYESWCRCCFNAYVLERYHTDPQKREQKLKNNLRTMYGISLSEYVTLLEAQGGVCAICKQPEETLDSRTKQRKRLVVDHDHRTGKVRGLLCQSCNSAIGFLEKKLDHLDSIVVYLHASSTDAERDGSNNG